MSTTTLAPKKTVRLRKKKIFLRLQLVIGDQMIDDLLNIIAQYAVEHVTVKYQEPLKPYFGKPAIRRIVCKNCHKLKGADIMHSELCDYCQHNLESFHLPKSFSRQDYQFPFIDTLP